MSNETNNTEPEKREQIRLLEEKIADLKRVIANLGSDIDELSLKKDLLITENNKFRGLLRECQKYFKYMTSADMPLDTYFDYMDVKLLDSINAAIGESEE